MIGDKYKRFIMIFCFFCILVMSAYSKQLVFERTVKNEVTGYDGKFYKENGTVTLFVNEFTSDKDGSKLGFAYAIKSESPETPISAVFLDGSKELNSEQDGGWLIYYEKEPFRTGWAHLAFSLGSAEAVDKLTEKLSRAGFCVQSGPRTTGDGYYESAIVAIEQNIIELTV